MYMACALLLCALVLPATAAGQGAPAGDEGARRWRVAYYQGGDYKDYHDYLVSIVRGLMALGLIELEPVPEQADKRTQPLWRWLATRARSRHLEFPADAWHDAAWDESRRRGMREALLRRLAAPSGEGDLDIVIAMGTWAGQDLATVGHSVPTTVVSASDPVLAGIVASTQDSGLDHVHAQIDPWRYQRQLRLFHDAAGFRRLGVVYEDTLAGRSYAAMEHVEAVARERGFEVVRCHAASDVPDVGDAERSLMDCFGRLARAADAIYVTVHSGVTASTLPQMVALAAEHRLPTFSQHGADEVRQGLLLSMSLQSFDPVGMFHARAIARILDGTTPRALPMVFEEEAKLAINLHTAHAIGFIPTADVLAGADLLFSIPEGLP